MCSFKQGLYLFISASPMGIAISVTKKVPEIESQDTFQEKWYSYSCEQEHILTVFALCEVFLQVISIQRMCWVLAMCQVLPRFKMMNLSQLLSWEVASLSERTIACMTVAWCHQVLPKRHRDKGEEVRMRFKREMERHPAEGSMVS